MKLKGSTFVEILQLKCIMSLWYIWNKVLRLIIMGGEISIEEEKSAKEFDCRYYISCNAR